MRIETDGRTFIVSFDDAGRVRIVKERKVYQPGRPWEALYDAPYWHFSHRRPQRGLAFRVISEAERRRAEAPARQVT